MSSARSQSPFSWLDDFVTYAGANLSGLGLVQADIDPIVTARGLLLTANASHKMR